MSQDWTADVSTRELHWRITVLALEPFCFTIDFDSRRTPF